MLLIIIVSFIIIFQQRITSNYKATTAKDINQSEIYSVTAPMENVIMLNDSMIVCGKDTFYLDNSISDKIKFKNY